MADEQEENLNEILGFDPNEQDSSVQSGVIETSKDLTPLQKTALAAGKTEEEIRELFLKNTIVSLSENKDTENLFSINKSSYDYKRTFWRYRKDLALNFGAAITTTIPTTDKYGLLKTEYSGEEQDTEKIIFNGYVNIYKKISDDRIVNVDYNPDGKLKRVMFGIYNGDANYGIVFDEKEKILKYFMHKEESFVDQYKSSRSRRNLIPPELEFGIREDGMVIIVLSKKGEETDRFSVPEEIDIEGIKAEMYPDELLKNPSNPDINLDKGVHLPPLARIGARWVVLEEETRTIPKVDDIT